MNGVDALFIAALAITSLGGIYRGIKENNDGATAWAIVCAVWIVVAWMQRWQ